MASPRNMFMSENGSSFFFGGGGAVARRYCRLLTQSIPVVAGCSKEIRIMMCDRASYTGVTGGTDQTSGGCSLCYTIPI